MRSTTNGTLMTLCKKRNLSGIECQSPRRWRQQLWRNFLLSVGVIVFALSILPNAFAGEMRETDTAAGFIKIENWEDRPSELEVYESILILEGEIIKTVGSQYVNITDQYNIQDSSILVFYVGYGGSGTTPDYFIVEFPKDKPPIITDYVNSADYSFSVKRKKNKVIIDLGFDSDLKKYAIYDNGALEIQKIESTKKKATRKDCRWIYKYPYQEYIEEKDCDRDPWMILGLSSSRNLRALDQDPSINLDSLSTMATEGCVSQHTLKYSEFRKIICQVH